MATFPSSLMTWEPVARAFDLQVHTHREFHRLAEDILGRSYPLKPLPANRLAIEKNFFSVMFLAITDRMIGPSPNLPLYAMVNQAMRAWVTACDNLLDDEDKEIFPFPDSWPGRRTRSIIALLLADRVLVEFIQTKYPGADVLRRTGRISLAALLPSAIQESEEEPRPVEILPPQRILEDIHVRKTGDLFLAPLAIPQALEQVPPERAAAAVTFLKQFGLACQILDDIKDFAADLRQGRHNLLASILSHQLEQASAVEALRHPEAPADWNAWQRFPRACESACILAAQRFHKAFENLASLGLALSDDDQLAVAAAMARLLGLPCELITRESGLP